MKFTIEIECDGAAFADNCHNYEVSRILRELADGLEDGLFDGNRRSCGLRDINGNHVGQAVLHE